MRSVVANTQDWLQTTDRGGEERAMETKDIN